MLKSDKIKELASVHAGKWTEKAAFVAAFGVTGLAVWLTVKTINKAKSKIDDIEWDGK